MQTTDGIYVRVDTGIWWDTRGIELVPESQVDLHIERNPNVGIVILG